jgi:hypothetical protein
MGADRRGFCSGIARYAAAGEVQSHGTPGKGTMHGDVMMAPSALRTSNTIPGLSKVMHSGHRSIDIHPSTAVSWGNAACCRSKCLSIRDSVKDI